MSTSTEQQNPIALATEIISAYVGNNTVPHESLPDLIKKVHQTVREEAREDGEPKPEASTKATPAQIRKSVTTEHLISFVDGKPYKTLKRHLTLQGMTPESYKQKFGLPADYPMVSKAYSNQRSELARKLGLGQRNRDANPVAAVSGPETEVMPPAEATERRRGGRKAAEGASQDAAKEPSRSTGEEQAESMARDAAPAKGGRGTGKRGVSARAAKTSERKASQRKTAAAKRGRPKRVESAPTA